MNSPDVQIKEYAAALGRFIYDYDLPPEWFAQPDYVAFSVAAGDHFDELMGMYRPDASGIVSYDREGRRAAAIRLSGELGYVSLEGFGGVRFVEVTDRAAEADDAEPISLDYAGFTYDNLHRVRLILKQCLSKLPKDSGPDHISIPIESDDVNNPIPRQRVKISTASLSGIFKGSKQHGAHEI